MLVQVTTKLGQSFNLIDKDFVDYDFKSNVTSSNDFELGGAIPNCFDFSIFDHNFKQYQLYGARIKVYLDDTPLNTKLLGEFTINSVDIEQDLIVCKSDDDLSNTDVKWVGRSFPCRMYEILTSVCNQCNIPLQNAWIPNGGFIIETSSGLEDVTCRQILKWIGEANGMYCILNSQNQLVYKEYDFENIKAIAQTDIDSLKLEQTNTTRQGIHIDKKNKTFGETQYPINIKDNPLLENLSDAALTTICNNIVKNIKKIDYYAGSFNLWNDNYYLHVGDVIKVIDNDGHEFVTIIHDITMNNEDEYFEINSYGDSIEDKNKRKNDTSEHTSGDDTSGGGSSDLQMGRVRNHQRIHAKQGRFTILEMSVDDINYFTKVNLELSINFTYTNNQFINFYIYANDKLIRSVPVMGTGQLYHLTEAFVADVDYTPTRCLYSVVVDIHAGETLTIEPFEAILSLKATNGVIKDNTATDQLFIEKIKKITSQLANQYKYTIKSITEEVAIDNPDPPEPYIWKVGELESTRLTASFTPENGQLRIYGDGLLDMESSSGEKFGGIGTASTIFSRLTSKYDSKALDDVLTYTTSIIFDITYAEKTNSWGVVKNNNLINFVLTNDNDDYTFTNLNTLNIAGNIAREVTFPNQKNLKHITGAVKGIRDISDCTSLTDVNFDNVLFINNAKKTSSLKNVIAPNCVTLVTTQNNGAFMNSGVEYIEMPLLTQIPPYTFYECESLVTARFVGLNSDIQIGAHAFDGCYSLSTFDGPIVAGVDEYAFYGCTVLDNIDLSTCKNVDSYAFKNSGLDVIDLSNCKTIYKGSFENSSITKVNFGATLPDFRYSATNNGDAFKNCLNMAANVVAFTYRGEDANMPITTFQSTSVDTWFVKSFVASLSHGAIVAGDVDKYLTHLKDVIAGTLVPGTVYICAEEKEYKGGTVAENAAVKDAFKTFTNQLAQIDIAVQTYPLVNENSVLNGLINS